MWVEVINVEKCCSVDEPNENSTVIPQRPEKGAGTNRQASEKSSSLVEIIAPWEQTWGDKHWGGDIAWHCASFGPLLWAVFRSVAAAAFSPRLQPGVGGENTIRQP